MSFFLIMDIRASDIVWTYVSYNTMSMKVIILISIPNPLVNKVIVQFGVKKNTDRYSCNQVGVIVLVMTF